MKKNATQRYFLIQEKIFSASKFELEMNENIKGSNPVVIELHTEEDFYNHHQKIGHYFLLQTGLNVEGEAHRGQHYSTFSYGQRKIIDEVMYKNASNFKEERDWREYVSAEILHEALEGERA